MGSPSHACPFQNHAIGEVTPCIKGFASCMEKADGGLLYVTCQSSLVTVCHPNESALFMVCLLNTVTKSASGSQIAVCPESPISNHGLSPCAILKSRFLPLIAQFLKSPFCPKMCFGTGVGGLPSFSRQAPLQGISAIRNQVQTT